VNIYIIEALVLIGAFLSICAFIISLRNLFKTKKKIFNLTSKVFNKVVTVDDLGIIEGKINDLSDVFVPCHRVDAPKGSMMEAVKINMKRGVRYTFLVSPENYTRSEKTYYQYFLAIAKTVSWESQGIFSINDLIRIRPLKERWSFKPHIFYKTKEDDNGIEATIVYRGDIQDVGLANNYTLLNPEDAIMAYSFLVNDVQWLEGDKEYSSKLFSLEREEFIDYGKFTDRYLDEFYSKLNI